MAFSLGRATGGLLTRRTMTMALGTLAAGVTGPRAADRALNQGGPLQRLSFGVMIPDPGALPRHCRELPGPVVQAGVGGLIAGAVEAGVPLDARAALASQCLVDLQGTRRGCTVGAIEHRGERDTVLDCLIGALTAMRQHWMRGISKQRQAPARPGRQRLAVVQPPS